MTSCLAFMTSCLAFMTSCFASASCCMCFASLSCFDDVVLLRSLFFRRRTSCFASTTRSAFRSRSGLLCATPCFARRHALLRHAALRGESISLLCLSLPLLSLSLPWRRRPLPFLAFSCSFLAGRTQNTAGPGLRLRAFDVPSSTCFFWRCKPSNRKFLRASRCFLLPAL